MLGAEAAPQEAVVGGETFKAGPIDDRAKSAWERWVQDRAIASLERACRGLPVEAQAAAAVEMAERLGGAEYSFYGAKCTGMMKSPEGMVRLTGLIFGMPQDKAALFFKEQPVRALAAVLLAINESLGSLPALADKLKEESNGKGEGAAPNA